jgi:DNA-binding PadR family transcriptional regulator
MDALLAGPLHGYGIIRAIARRTHDLHSPSPGSVYPALRWLTRRGYLVAIREGRRTVYRLTREGRGYLDELKRDLGGTARLYEFEHGVQRATLLWELREATRLVETNLQNLTPARAVELRGVVARLRGQVIAALARSGR